MAHGWISLPSLTQEHLPFDFFGGRLPSELELPTCLFRDFDGILSISLPSLYGSSL